MTFEDPAVTTPEGRFRAFYQTDHVRLYGLDIADRLADVGFTVETKTIRQLPASTIIRNSLNHLPTNEVFTCTRIT